MGVPNVYQTKPETQVNYSFTDITARTGYIEFYVVGGTDGTYVLTPQVIATAEDETSYVSTDVLGADVLVNEFDIDYEFQTPQTVKGQAIVSLSYTCKSNGNNVGAYTKVRIYHYDGSTETEIGTQQSTNEVFRNAAGDDYTRETVILDLTRKNFRVGDKLRLNIELRTSAWGAGGTTQIQMYMDGKNRDFSTFTFKGEALPTDIKFLAPFEIDL